MTFVEADAADLTQFDDHSFDVVMFSYNGLDYLAPASQRSRALTEIRRVLRPDGTYIMSTHNPRAVIRRAPRRGSTPRQLAISLLMTANALRSRGLSRTMRLGYGFHNDHVQGLETYFATPERLIRELVNHDFVPVDIVGSDYPAPVRPWITPWTYVAAKPSAPSVNVTRAVPGGAKRPFCSLGSTGLQRR